MNSFSKIFNHRYFQDKDASFSPENQLIRFDNKHLLVLCITLAVIVLGVLFKLHGYSLPEWRVYIDGSHEKEIVFGSSRGIRCDDWAVEIPLMLSQLKHEKDAFPLYNTVIGEKVNMLVHSKVAIAHPITFFRPSVWGFFIGGDYGLSWMWWFMVGGLFYTYFLVLMLVSRNHFLLSVTGSLFICFSPFFQFWSMHMAEIPIFMGLIFVSFAYLCFSGKTPVILTNALLLGWFLGCYAFNFVYPPYQVSCAYLLLFMMIGFFFDRYSDFKIKHLLFFRLGGITISLAIFFCGIFIYFLAVGPILEIMMNTVYPGQRFSLGGDHNLGHLYRNNFLLPLYGIIKIDWSQTHLGNICESSSFFFIFFPLALALCWKMITDKQITDLFSFVLLGYFLLIGTYIFFGFSPVLSKYTLFSMMQSFRSVIGLGIANAVFAVSFLSKNLTFKTLEKLIICGFWFVLLIIAGSEIKNLFPQINDRYIFLLSLANAFLGYHFLTGRTKQKAFVILLAVSFFSTSWFNPLVAGGEQFLFKNDLSKKIMEIDEREKGDTVWITYGSWVVANLPRILGVNSINGTHPHPQFKLWAKLDPLGLYKEEYNRYAHVSFTSEELPGAKAVRDGKMEGGPLFSDSNKMDNSPDLPAIYDQMQIYSPSADQIFIVAKPTAELLGKLGVTHLLVTEETREFDIRPNLKKVYALGNKHIYEVLY